MKSDFPGWLLRFVVILSLVGFLVGYAHRRIPSVEVGVDDANIFLVYAQNVAHGQGFVFNAGGERVEGFSSISWVLIGALFCFLGHNAEWWLCLFNAVIVALALSLAMTAIDRLSAARTGRAGLGKVSLTSLLLLAWAFSSPGYVCWTTLTLMETGLWSALLVAVPFVLAGAVDLWRSRRAGTIALTALMPLLVLTRPEGMLWGIAVLVLYLFLLVTLGTGLRAAVKRAAAPAAAFVGTWLLLSAFRLAYFGYPFPNTYYAKISPDKAYDIQQGWVYFREFLASNRCLLPLLGIAVISAAAFALWLTVRGRRATAESRALPIAGLSVAAVACLGAVVPILVGGDHFRSFRFYQPVWPLLVLPVCFCLAVVWRGLDPGTWPGRLAGLRYALMVPVIVALPKVNAAKWTDLATTGITHEFALAKEGRDNGEYLNHAFGEAKPPSLGVVAVGGIKYAYHGPILDLMGLNNVEMAHFPGDRKGIKNHASFSKEVFYRQLPDGVFLLVAADVPDKDLSRAHPFVAKVLGNRWVIGPVRGLYDDAEFRARYKLAAVRPREGADPRRVLAFFRNDYLEKLKGMGSLDVVVAGD